MPDIPGFWQGGPHVPVLVEAVWAEFVPASGGEVVSKLVPNSPSFENADYLFRSAQVVAELKEIETEFSSSKAFLWGLAQLHHRVFAENPSWRPLFFGGDGKYPSWFYPEFVRLFRPPISRILKKANRQIRDTKSHFGIATPTGVLLLVNDGFTSLGPDLIQSLASDLLLHSYSSIDCMVYLTVNRYVEIRGSDVPRLMWAPVYSDRAADSLVAFVNDLGRKWFKFLEEKIGPFSDRTETEDRSTIVGAQSIVLPDEHVG